MSGTGAVAATLAVEPGMKADQRNKIAAKGKATQACTHYIMQGLATAAMPAHRKVHRWG